MGAERIGNSLKMLVINKKRKKRTYSESIELSLKKGEVCHV